MKLLDAIKPKKGITAVIGSGGKSVFINSLAESLSASARVLVCSAFESPLPADAVVPEKGGLDAIAAAVDRAARAGLPAVAGEVSNGLLLPCDIDPERFLGLADYVLYEADHSTGLPLIAHEKGKPHIPSAAADVIELVGLHGLCRPVYMAACNPERYSELSGLDLDDFVSPEAAAKVINKEALQTTLLINHADSKEWYAEALLLADAVKTRCLICSVKKGSYHIYK